MRPLRVTQVITGLDPPGGAEILLARLVERLHPDDVHADVISLTSRGAVGARISAGGVNVRALGLPKRPAPASVIKLRRAIAERRPDVVQTWLLHANVLGGIAGRAAGAPVVWGVHISRVSPAAHGRAAAITRRAEQALSRLVPAAIVACSDAAERGMLDLRYPRGRIETIHNGFDLDELRPDPGARVQVRRELGLGDDDLVVGHIARFHPMKDHATMFAAAQRVVDQVPNARFVFCGPGVSGDNPEVARLAQPLGDRARLLGERDDVRRILAALDVLALSSSAGEALPLVVGEAMATEVPVVATRCGDCPQLVGETGRIVPIGDPIALGGALAELLSVPRSERARLGAEARARIAAGYEIGRMVARYEELWRRV